MKELNKPDNSRRNFIKQTAIAGAGITIGGMGFSSKSYASIRGANDRIMLAVVGVRGQGQTHIKNWTELNTLKNIRVKTLCDADEHCFDQPAKIIVDKGGNKPATEIDMRKVFDDKEIDAVSFATPNHWHALGTIWACQQGKHVYVEKPASHNVWEGRKMIEAARKYKRRVQVGFQNRSFANVREAVKFLHDGGIGDVFMARGLCINAREPFGIAEDGTPPPNLHYDRWLGPVTYRPYNEKKVHYNWHWFWDTGNGDTGNQGPHQFDIARWGLNKNEHPVSVYSTGGIYGFNPRECAQETPTFQSSLFKYHDGKMLEFETRGGYSNSESGLDIRIGNIFYGTGGHLELERTNWRAFRKREKEPFAGSKVLVAKTVDPRVPPGGAEHYANFIDAIRAGSDDVLNCDISEGFLSTSLPLLANISYRLKRELKFVGDREKFHNDKEANTMLTRKYRPPYIVPEQV